ncbi:MAG: hypothetical protein ACK533_02915, partial [Planctomycetota bacterium]
MRAHLGQQALGARHDRVEAPQPEVVGGEQRRDEADAEGTRLQPAVDVLLGDAAGRHDAQERQR